MSLGRCGSWFHRAKAGAPFRARRPSRAVESVRRLVSGFRPRDMRLFRVPSSSPAAGLSAFGTSCQGFVPLRGIIVRRRQPVCRSVLRLSAPLDVLLPDARSAGSRPHHVQDSPFRGFSLHAATLRLRSSCLRAVARAPADAEGSAPPRTARSTSRLCSTCRCVRVSGRSPLRNSSSSRFSVSPRWRTSPPPPLIFLRSPLRGGACGRSSAYRS